MGFQIKTTDGTTFMALMSRAVSEELAEKAKAYVQTNIVELEKFQSAKGQLDNFRHFVVYVENESEKTVGFRYFFFELSSSFCHLFATFVESNYRRIGIATQLILESFAIAAENGCTEFEIRLTQPSYEKDALFEWYRRFARANSHRFKFTIYYWTQLEKYGYN